MAGLRTRTGDRANDGAACGSELYGGLFKLRHEAVPLRLGALGESEGLGGLTRP